MGETAATGLDEAAVPSTFVCTGAPDATVGVGWGVLSCGDANGPSRDAKSGWSCFDSHRTARKSAFRSFGGPASSEVAAALEALAAGWAGSFAATGCPAPAFGRLRDPNVSAKILLTAFN